MPARPQQRRRVPAPGRAIGTTPPPRGQPVGQDAPRRRHPAGQAAARPTRSAAPWYPSSSASPATRSVRPSRSRAARSGRGRVPGHVGGARGPALQHGRRPGSSLRPPRCPGAVDFNGARAATCNSISRSGRPAPRARPFHPHRPDSLTPGHRTPPGPHPHGPPRPARRAPAGVHRKYPSHAQHAAGAERRVAQAGRHPARPGATTRPPRARAPRDARRQSTAQRARGAAGR